jgi:homoaconitate hydratase
MGSRDAHGYLASPAVVAASALAGRIVGPRSFEVRDLAVSCRAGKAAAADSVPPQVADAVPGFPDRLQGELLLIPRDDLNTDAIYPKDVTYRDGLPDEEMARHAFRNHDPEFAAVARPGDLLVGGANFGSGSSREQAVTALRAFGLPIVIAVSFSQTYRRNAFNNGFPLVECGALVEHVRARAATDRPTGRVGLSATVDFRRSVVVVDGMEFPFPPLPMLAQRLIALGGVEAMVRGAQWTT